MFGFAFKNVFLDDFCIYYLEAMKMRSVKLERDFEQNNNNKNKLERDAFPRPLLKTQKHRKMYTVSFPFWVNKLNDQTKRE